MTFLELCKRLRQEAGIAGTGPDSVLSQTGQNKQVVDWITAAYEAVQLMHSTWRFLRADFSFATIESIQEYTPTAVGLTDFATWIRDDIRLYENLTDEQFLEYYPWDEFRINYMFGSHRTVEGRPVIVSIKPNDSLMLWQLPNSADFTVIGEYYQTPDVMEANDDEPIFPVRYHMIVVWKALKDYAGFTAADEKYVHGNTEYTRILHPMELKELPDILYGEPLA